MILRPWPRIGGPIQGVLDDVRNALMALLLDSVPRGRVDLMGGDAQTVPTATETAVEFGVQIEPPTGAFYHSVDDPTRIICNADGYVLALASCSFESAASGAEMWIYKNEPGDYWGDSYGQGGAVAAIIPVSAGDALMVYAQQTSGSDVNLKGQQSRRFQARYVRG